MIFRGRAPERSVWRRFGSGKDVFTFSQNEEGLYEAHVIANAERVLDLFYTLSEHLLPAINILVVDKRNKRSWTGKDVALPDVRDAIARLKVPFASSGGVEVSLYTANDQLTVTATLGLYAYARSDRWLYLLQSIGLEQTGDKSLARNQPWDRGPAKALNHTLETIVQRLSLVPQ